MAADIENLYIHSDRLDSSVHVLDKTGRMAMRLGYSPMGRTYRKYDDVMTYYYDLEPLANYEFAQLMPYRFTGKFTDFNTGLTQMDARWYNPHTARFLQPDHWNLRNTHLPVEIQHELMQFAGLNTAQLLRDPAQQMAYGYVRGNPLRWVDPMGLYVANAVGAVAGGVLDAAVQGVEMSLGIRDKYDFTQTAIAAVSGGLGGGIGASATKLAASVGSVFSNQTAAKVAATVTNLGVNSIGNAALGATAGAVNDYQLGNDITVNSIQNNAVIGAAFGAIGTVATGAIPKGALDAYGDVVESLNVSPQSLSGAFAAEATISKLGSVIGQHSQSSEQQCK